MFTHRLWALVIIVACLPIARLYAMSYKLEDVKSVIPKESQTYIVLNEDVEQATISYSTEFTVYVKHGCYFTNYVNYIAKYLSSSKTWQGKFSIS